MVESSYLVRKAAAAVCGCSEDTLRRDQRAGKLPHTRRGSDGSVVYAVADLVAAGRLDPLAADESVGEVAGRSRSERDLTDARTELAVARARIAELSVRVERAEGEVAFLRSMLASGRVA